MSILRKKQSYLQMSLIMGQILQSTLSIHYLRNILFGVFITTVGTISSFAQTTHAAKHKETTVQSQGLRLRYKQIDASGFPKIVSYVNVSDDAGFMVAGLTKDDFLVHEDNVYEFPIEVDVEGISVVLVLDRSLSMHESNSFDDVKAAASNFIQLLHGQDQAAVISFNKDITVEHPFSSDKTSLIAAISRLVSVGATHLNDAVVEAANLIETQEGRRAIILLTDGADGGSDNSHRMAINSVQETGTPLITIGLGLASGSPQEKALITFADATGGLYFASPTSADLLGIYSAIASLLRSPYKISYTTHNTATDGKVRHVQIDVQDQGLTHQDTASYRAPNHIVTVAPVTAATISPGIEFGLDIEIPSTSKYLYHRMKNFDMTLKYDQRYFKVKRPFEQNIVAGSLFGAVSDHDINIHVDENSGLITLTLSKNAGSGLLEGRGQLAHINFETDINLSDSTSFTFEIADHQATDENNWPIATQAQDLTLLSYGLIVWPGDIDENGTVELIDVTLLGVYWGITGPGRPTELDLLAWKPQLSGRYPRKSAAHADTDGSGLINERDLVPIGLNWGKSTFSTSTVAKQIPAVTSSAPLGNLRTKLSYSDEPGKYFLHLVYVGSQAARIRGITFSVFYPAGNMVITAAKAGKAWPARPLFISSPDNNSGKIAVGVMLTADSPVLEQGGELVKLEIQSETIPDLAKMRFENVGLVSADGVIHDVLVDNSMAEVTLTMPTNFTLFPAYPNPFNPSTKLPYALAQAGKVEVRIYNVTGRLILSSAENKFGPGEYIWRWDGRDQNDQTVSTGVYFVQFRFESLSGKTWTGGQKITLIK